MEVRIISLKSPKETRDRNSTKDNYAKGKEKYIICYLKNNNKISQVMLSNRYILI
jgi:hypothetical protein